MSAKKRGFFSWLFFQDPDKGKNKTEQPEVEVLLADINAPAPARWVELTVFLDGMPTDMKMTLFPFNIGRIGSPGGIKIDDKGISRQHATMDLQNGILTITDTNSKNGVSVGPNKIFPGAPTPLNRGDSVKMGRAEIIVKNFPAPAMAYAPHPAAVQTALFSGTEYLPEAAPELPPSEAPATPLSSAEPAAAPDAPVIPAAPAEPAFDAGPSTQVLDPAVSGLKCANCGAQNDAGYKFCKSCGKPAAASAAPPISGSKPFCNKCGAKNVKLANFCVGCGNNLK